LQAEEVVGESLSCIAESASKGGCMSPTNKFQQVMLIMFYNSSVDCFYIVTNLIRNHTSTSPKFMKFPVRSEVI
jgi:hypothetical protein